LHTSESLKSFGNYAGFTDINIIGIQRYPLSNHLYWLSEGKPGGHNIFDFLDTKEYENNLIKNNISDTLIAIYQ
jgi:hypothetical protein